jgi:H+/Cl- antiporter ClcA
MYKKILPKNITEWLVLFASVVKWAFLSTIIGIIVGTAAAGFLTILEYAVNFVNSISKYYFLLLPFGLFLPTVVTMYVSPDSAGHGTEKIIEAIHRKFGALRLRVVPVKMITTIITLATGGSVGKEGPTAQIGGALASSISDLFRFNERDRKRMVICGISAGFAAVFGTPIAGAIFGVEILFVGTLLYGALLPSYIAGMISCQVAAFMGVHYFHPTIALNPGFSPIFYGKVILAGLFFGCCCIFFIESMKYVEHSAERIKIWKPFVGLIGGVLLIVLTLIFSTDYLGLGGNQMYGILNGATDIIWYAFILKVIFTAITLGFGGSGGIVTPIFYIGATSGVLIGHLLGVDPVLFAAIGLCAVLSGCTNAPIAASIMAVEVFGAPIAPYAALACIISFIITGHRSAYPSQILAMNKSSSIIIHPGDDIQSSTISFEYKLLKMFVRARRRFEFCFLSTKMFFLRNSYNTKAGMLLIAIMGLK